MNTYFNGYTTPESIKTRYRTLAKQYHPDLGGDTATMQAINAEYLKALQNIDGHMSTGADGKEHRYTYNADIEQAVIDQLRILQSLRLPESVTIALIGTWIWVRGDTRPHKDALKNAGCKWSGEKLCWYWHAGSYRRKSAHSGNFGGMAMRYGYREFGNSNNEKALGN